MHKGMVKKLIYIARGEAIFASRSHLLYAIFCIVHKPKRYINWFIAEHYFQYFVFQGKI